METIYGGDGEPVSKQISTPRIMRGRKGLRLKPRPACNSVADGLVDVSNPRSAVNVIFDVDLTEIDPACDG